MAALVLAALGLFGMLVFAAESALCLRNGYTGITLRQDIEDLKARNALLRYQVNLSESSHRVEQVANRLSLRPADPLHEIDYVVLPEADRAGVRVASDPDRAGRGLSGVMATLATQMVGSAAGHAEASTGASHRP